MTSRSWRAGLAIAAATTVTASCARNAPQDTWQPKGDNARTIDNLQRPVFAIAGLVLLIVFGVVVFCVIKFRDRGQEMPEQTHGKPALEIALTVLPALILLGVGIPTVSTVFKLAKTDDAECRINVTGQQWWWEYDYAPGTCGGVEIPEPIVTSGELVIPSQVDVLLTITSRDVIHSFWIPALNGKRDAVPGRTHTLRMEADEPGIYAGQCTEFCGLSHSRMRMMAVALNQADFATWVDNQLEPYAAPAADSVAAAGELLFQGQCAQCHQINDMTKPVDTDGDGTSDANQPVLADPDLLVVSGAAPNLTNLMTRSTFAGATYELRTDECRERLWTASPDEFGAEYLNATTPDCLNEDELREWLRNAPGKKPMYAAVPPYRGMPNLNLTDDQIDLLIAFLLERK